MRFITNFLRDEQGQDLIEYTLLLAFVALASAALFISAGGSINAIWTNCERQAQRCGSNISKLPGAWAPCPLFPLCLRTGVEVSVTVFRKRDSKEGA